MAENLSKRVVKGALNKTGQKHLNHVAIEGGNEAKKGAATATPAQVTVPPPAMGFQLKDEVELLRGGFKNTHGEQVKTQASQGQGGGAAASNAPGNNQPPPPTGKSQDAVEITI